MATTGSAPAPKLTGATSPGQTPEALEELTALLRRCRGRPAKLDPVEVRRLGALQRVVAAELAQARRRRPDDPRTAQLEAAATAAYAALHGRAGVSSFSLWDFLANGYWRRVREDRGALVLAIALLVVPGVLGYLWALHDPGRAGALTPGAYQAVTQPRPNGPGLGLSEAIRSGFATSIFTHNIGIAFLAFAGGMTAGLLTIASLAYNGVTLGVTAGLAAGAGQGTILLRLVAPHGVLELSCIAVAGASGLRVARAIVAPGAGTRVEALVAVAPAAAQMVLGTAVWLVVAGLVEGFVTPSGLTTPAALAVGLGLGATFWGLTVMRGRRVSGAATSIGASPGSSPLGSPA
jgi:uncharacterized membrane protein SpoIIM required for sporulation